MLDLVDRTQPLGVQQTKRPRLIRVTGKDRQLVREADQRLYLLLSWERPERIDDGRRFHVLVHSIDDLTRQGIDVESALFKNLYSGVPVHYPTVGLDTQCFNAARTERSDDIVRGQASPVGERATGRTRLK